MSEEEHSAIIGKLEELRREIGEVSDAVWKGNGKDSIVNRLTALELQVGGMQRSIWLLLAVAAPGLVTLLALGAKAWLTGASG